MTILGYVDALEAGHMRGWASDSEAPSDPVMVEVLVDDQVVASGLAAEHRPDLAAVGIAGGRCGFAIAVPRMNAEFWCRVGSHRLPPSYGDEDDETKARKAGKFWDTISSWRPLMAPRTRWNESPRIVRDVNFRVCGSYLDGDNRGLIELFKHMAAASLPIGRAVSVGCGAGIKEMALVREGLVDHFDLFDVSADSIQRGAVVAQEWGIADKLRFIHGDVFEQKIGSDYDLVYWDHALHHMFDSDAAVRWSHAALKPGGWFVMSDFVGANRFQWADDVIKVADLVRRSLPEPCFVNPINPDAPYDRGVQRPTLQQMEYDPSEAADSEAILPAILKHFPDASIRHQGGTIYHMALNDVLTNIPEDSDLLEYLLRLDRNITDIPHYAVAIAQKSANRDHPDL